MNESNLPSPTMLDAIDVARQCMSRLAEARTFRVERLAPCTYRINTGFSDGFYDQKVLVFDPHTQVWTEHR